MDVAVRPDADARPCRQSSLLEHGSESCRKACDHDVRSGLRFAVVCLCFGAQEVAARLVPQHTACAGVARRQRVLRGRRCSGLRSVALRVPCLVLHLHPPPPKTQTHMRARPVWPPCPLWLCPDRDVPQRIVPKPHACPCLTRPHQPSCSWFGAVYLRGVYRIATRLRAPVRPHGACCASTTRSCGRLPLCWCVNMMTRRHKTHPRAWRRRQWCMLMRAPPTHSTHDPAADCCRACCCSDVRTSTLT
jgi:hypothetical protein